MEELVSVIIPTYNRGHIIKNSIESVLNQSYKNLELIIIDDGSTDNTFSVISSIEDDRIRYIFQEHSNANVARNLGINESKGKYIAFNDSDDEWEPEKLKIQLKYMQENNAKVSFCSIKRIVNNNAEIVECSFPNGFIPKNMLMSLCITTPCIVAEKSVFKNCLFDEILLRWQDWDWVIRVSLYNDFFYVKVPLLKYYATADSITNRYNDEQSLSILNYLQLKHKELIKHNPAGAYFLLTTGIKYKKHLGKRCIDEYHQVYLLNKTARNYMKYLL